MVNFGYFTREEFECSCGCGFDAVDIELLSVLNDVREHFQAPLTINSACRCCAYNEVVQLEADSSYVANSSKSQHMYGKACDIVVSGVTPERVQDYLLSKYPNSKGIGSYSSFTHVDVRHHKSRW